MVHLPHMTSMYINFELQGKTFSAVQKLRLSDWCMVQCNFCDMRLPPTEGPTLRDDSDLIQFPYVSKIRMQLDDIKIYIGSKSIDANIQIENNREKRNKKIENLNSLECTNLSTKMCFTMPNFEHSSWTSSFISRSKSGSVCAWQIDSTY